MDSVGEDLESFRLEKTSLYLAVYLHGVSQLSLAYLLYPLSILSTQLAKSLVEDFSPWAKDLIMEHLRHLREGV